MELLSVVYTVDPYSWWMILVLIFAGFLVGIINTFAGSGSAITYTVYMMLGLPATLANGTLRITVFFQTLAASITFFRKNVLDLKKALLLGIPTVLGSIAGAEIAVNIDESLFQKILGFAMLIMLYFVLRSPDSWIKGKEHKIKPKPTFLQVIIFFLIGIYGGFLHIGVGIFLLAGLVLNAGYDLVKANAIKVFIVLMYNPFALAVYMINGQVDYGLGIVTAIGGLLGGFVASHLAVKKGAGFARWILIIVLVFFIGKLFGLYSFVF
jgi:uncharacterized membrane protein YfcA